MSKRDKLRQKLRTNPTDVKYQQLETLLIRFGFVLVRVKGSHHLFHYEDDTFSQSIIIPVHGKRVKPVYVTDVINILDKYFPEQESDFDEKDSEDE